MADTRREAAEALAAIDQGFRDTYLDYDALTNQVHAWAETFPELVRVTSLGTSDEGRSLWLLTIGREPDRIRPAVWIDGNMHASELAGSSVALALAEDALRLHLGLSERLPTLPDPVTARVQEVLFYVLPRISPDGAEAVLTTGQWVRSLPRDQRPDKSRPRWRAQDIDGDGLMLRMRVEDPGGEYVESPQIPGLMVPRRIDDEGPFYKIYPEGVIESFDGHTVPSPDLRHGGPTDLNRNFPWSWAPEPHQLGAGPFPLSEAESRAVVEFTSGHPEIFAWLNCHTFGGVFIRPRGDVPDNKMDPSDLALFRQIGVWAKEHTGYPMVSGFEEFTYEPDKPLHGDLSDYAYHQRGCVAYVVELWDLFRQAGFPKDRYKRFVDQYTQLDRDDLEALARWDRDENQGRMLRPWVRCEHPQLGPVEVGGLDPRIGMWNPPPERVPEICRQQSAAFLRVAALAPVLRDGEISAESLGGGLTRLSVTVENHGYLPTYVLSSARQLDFCEPVYVELACEGCDLVDGAARRELGHLDGWGRGLHDGTGTLHFQVSRGNTGARTTSYVVSGAGTVTVRVGCCRTGWIERRVDIPG
ncbi:M14 family metallopeptidase [Haliangium sp.]|uniref:M14 family metallopeptidase n=1 Tax=Haliangium sp. TaxID=2663208 RepID=UPI003D13BEE7